MKRDYFVQIELWYKDDCNESQENRSQHHSKTLDFGLLNLLAFWGRGSLSRTLGLPRQWFIARVHVIPSGAGYYQANLSVLAWGAPGHTVVLLVVVGTFLY